jgi:hypothetical protein
MLQSRMGGTRNAPDGEPGLIRVRKSNAGFRALAMMQKRGRDVMLAIGSAFCSHNEIGRLALC